MLHDQIPCAHLVPIHSVSIFIFISEYFNAKWCHKTMFAFQWDFSNSIEQMPIYTLIDWYICVMLSTLNEIHVIHIVCCRHSFVFWWKSFPVSCMRNSFIPSTVPHDTEWPLWHYQLDWETRFYFNLILSQTIQLASCASILNLIDLFNIF